jgi:hypothetical protein
MFVFLVSCSYTPNIVGKWQEPGTTSSIEFWQDGTFTAIDNMGMTVNGNYTILDKGKIRLVTKHQDYPDEIIMRNFAVREDELILTLDKDREVLTYKKIQ